MKKTLLLSFSILMLAVAATPSHAADDLVLGFSMAKTGPYVSLANTNEIAVDLAVEEINAKGGIAGRKIRVVKFDTGGDPKQAALAANQFAGDDNALAIIGPFSSSEVRVAFPVGERLGIVQTSMSSSAPGLTKGFSYGFRNTTDEAKVIEQVIAEIKAKGVPLTSSAIIYAADDTVSKAIGTGILPAIFDKNAIPLKGSIGFQYNAFDLSPQVSQLAQLKVDVVGVGAPPEGAINLVKELQRQEVKTLLIGGATFADPDLPQRMGPAGDNVTIGTTFFADVNERTRAFTAEFAKRAKVAGLRVEPNQMDAAVYDIVYLYADAIERAKISGDPAKKSLERTAIRDALARTKDYDGLEGKLSFDENRDMMKPIHVLKAQGNRWTLLSAKSAK